MGTRRGNGEGSITKRGDGRWMGQANLGWQDGKRCRKTVYGRTKREVQDKLREALHRSDLGLPALPEQETVGAFLLRWLVVKEGQVRPRTFESYEQVVRCHLEPGLGHLRLAKLGPRDIASWLQRRQAQGTGVRTLQYARAVLRAALNQALRWEIVSRNAAALTDPPRHRAREIDPLTPIQAKTLLAAVAGHRLEALITVALALGLRRGEALGLQWNAVDLDAGVLSIRHTLDRTGGDAEARRRLRAERRRLLAEKEVAKSRAEVRRLSAALDETQRQSKAVKSSLRMAEPKSTRSRRTITLPALAVTALRSHRTRQLEERLVAGNRWCDSGMVFTTTIGTPLGTQSLHRSFKSILRNAGLPDIRYHDLRHTAATLLLAQGVDPRTIMETLGHSQISLTLNTYAHVVPALQREAAAKMDEILSR